MELPNNQNVTINFYELLRTDYTKWKFQSLTIKNTDNTQKQVNSYLNVDSATDLHRYRDRRVSSITRPNLLLYLLTF